MVGEPARPAVAGHGDPTTAASSRPAEHPPYTATPRARPFNATKAPEFAPET
uniref:Uncharacterized protein n=1 Tax=Zea mays TaxID=4577 RepID=C0PK23_MAIZE|nr:unknown [Zea mays]